jgi:hypothetical protein
VHGASYVEGIYRSVPRERARKERAGGAHQQRGCVLAATRFGALAQKERWVKELQAARKFQRESSSGRRVKALIAE